jgi:hypothetical protein
VAKVYKRMPFGAHRGKQWENVPLDYLIWCLENLRHLRPSLVGAMSAEVSRRQGGAARPPARECGTRRSAEKYRPYDKAAWESAMRFWMEGYHPTDPRALDTARDLALTFGTDAGTIIREAIPAYEAVVEGLANRRADPRAT